MLGKLGGGQICLSHFFVISHIYSCSSIAWHDIFNTVLSAKLCFPEMNFTWQHFRSPRGRGKSAAAVFVCGKQIDGGGDARERRKGEKNENVGGREKESQHKRLNVLLSRK